MSQKPQKQLHSKKAMSNSGSSSATGIQRSPKSDQYSEQIFNDYLQAKSKGPKPKPKDLAEMQRSEEPELFDPFYKHARRVIRPSIPMYLNAKRNLASFYQENKVLYARELPKEEEWNRP